MIDTVQLIILAILQGLTEFLPISSSAHLILPTQLFGWQDQGLAFDVGVHLGTLFAVLAYFRKDVWQLLQAWFGSFVGCINSQSYLAWYLILASIPAVVFGLLVHDFIAVQGRSILLIAATTLIFGALLWYANTKVSVAHLSLQQLSAKQAFYIGCAQALALIPGTSRSGITLSMGLLLGLNTQTAARFSFLLSIPVILGASLFKGQELILAEQAEYFSMILLAAIIAAVSAFSCIHLFLRALERIGLMPFVIYRFILGFSLLAVYFLS